MVYVLPVIAAAALIALYIFLPNRKIFKYFCATFAIVFCVSAFIRFQHARQEIVSRAQIEEIRQQQQIFSEWYAAYQKDIEHLDRNWQLYHSLVENLKTADIYEFSTYERLSDLEADALDEQTHIHALKIPDGLNSECAALLEEIIRKTQSYVDAQTKTISAVKAAANPDVVANLNALNRRIKDITIRESPAGLFTAAEVSAIRDLLIVPGEGVDR